MQLSDLRDAIKDYMHIEGTTSNDMIDTFINESIVDFIRMDNWKKCMVADDLTLDDSEEYNLTSANLSSTFERELELLLPYSSSNETDVSDYTKYEYKKYLTLPSKDFCYAIFGTKIYVLGDDTTLKFLYMSPGDFINYPLTDNTDEVPATIYYVDIIKRLTVVKFLDYFQEDSSKEMAILTDKIKLLKRSEKIGDHAGKFKMIARVGNRPNQYR